MDDCIFCKIVSREISANIVYEDENNLAFLDISPANEGHTLVIPKHHFSNLYEIPEKNLQNLSSAVKRVALGVKEAVDPKGINIIQNNDKAAGQVVFHLHFHVVPRDYEDGNEFKFNNLNPSDEEQKKTAKRVRDSIKVPHDTKEKDSGINSVLDNIDKNLESLDRVLEKD